MDLHVSLQGRRDLAGQIYQQIRRSIMTGGGSTRWRRCCSSRVTQSSSRTRGLDGGHQRALTTVAYTYEHGRWLAVLDQGTFLEPPS